MMKHKKINYTLIFWELEDIFIFPIFEIMVLVAIVFFMSFASRSMRLYDVGFKDIFGFYENSEAMFPEYLSSLSSLALISLIFSSFLFAKSLAGKFNNGELKTLLSYPIKRRDIIIYKFLTNLIVLYLIVGVLSLLDAYLIGLNVFGLPILISLASLFVFILFFCSVSMLISLVFKNESLTIFTSLLLYFSFEFFIQTIGNVYKDSLSLNRIVFNITGYIINLYYSDKFSLFNKITYDMFLTSSLFILITSVLSILFSLLYFVYFLEVD
ncbi:MAG: ABC transporter permease subunit [Candidatus Asgardarchaeia archaeon]